MTTLHWTAGLHHDGSAVYVSNPTPKADEKVTITLRAPINAPIHKVFLRSAPDGEGHHAEMTIARRDAISAYWTVEFQATMPRNHYRFRILTREGAYFLNALGVSRADGPDWYDFKLLTDYITPAWALDSVFYQIFPDRFHNGVPALTVKPGAWRVGAHSVQVRPWGTAPLPWREGGNLDFFGGDLPGIGQKLDYLQRLGITGIYLTPIFTSRSNHRYNIEDFDHVDPHLGGNAALADLRRALDEHHMTLMLDLTPNHVGSTHPWFTEAQTDPNAPTTEFFTFYQHPNDYAMWLGVRTLPKLNYRSEKLRAIMYAGHESIMRRWLREPYRIDAWRLDVANMTARQGSIQLDHKVGRGMRRAVKAENPQAYLIGENFFDATPYLQGDELDAVMNYQGFNIPMWRWLSGFDNGFAWGAGWSDHVEIPSEAFTEHIAAYRSAIPWVIANQQFNQLGSHDTPRILNIVGGDRALAKLGVSLLMTYPGVPCVYYGDEIGMTGAADPDNRRTMIWDESEWDQELFQHYQTVIALRKSAPALKHGGYQQIYAQGGVFAFQRHSTEQRLIIVAARDGETELTLPIWHAGIADGATLTDLLSGRAWTVQAGAITFGALDKATLLVLEG
ncbi:MAG: alpha-amylase family glycosyl hydrolase [Anaerolineae bacterium]|jgi:alpha-glucosidase|nr:alpha-amylase family glycosyl hydrolase [Anaerolineae bacterium]